MDAKLVCQTVGVALTGWGRDKVVLLCFAPLIVLIVKLNFVFGISVRLNG
jgi:hypothetical protein